MSAIGDKLKMLRGSQSQRDMADALGIKYQQWAKYERGEVSPGADMLKQICLVHACSADWLLGLPERGGSAAAPPPATVNLDELRSTATQLAEASAALAGTIKRLKKML